MNWPEPQPDDPIGKTDADLTLIRTNLRLTPEERLRKADAARRELIRQQEAGVVPPDNRSPEERAEESLAWLLAIKRVREEMEREKGPPPGKE